MKILFVKLLVLSVIIVSLTSCDQISGTIDKMTGDDNTSQVQASDTLVEQIVLPLYITNVDQLRLRKYPDTKSRILTTLDENSIIHYVNEQTDYVESIGKHTAPWLKVKTSQGDFVGWVYGASFFVEPFLTALQIDSIRQLEKDIHIFEHKGRREMNEMTGANWGKSVPGTRFSGCYTYDVQSSSATPNGKVVIRARIFDTEKKEVQFLHCSLIVENGMPMSEVMCLESEEIE